MKRTSGKGLARLSTAAIMIALVLAVSAVPVLGAGKGRGASKSEPAPATLQASCNPCAFGQDIRFTGSGYDASQGQVLLDMGGLYTAAAVSSSGAIDFLWTWDWAPGSHTVNVYQKANKKHNELKATLTIQVLASSG